MADLILSGNSLYGTAKIGGIAGHGTVFAINTDGTGFTNLHQFTAYAAGYLTNSDGATPMAGLILPGNTLYGTTQRGGLKGYGTVFALNTDGTHFTTVHHFTNIPDGAGPTAGLVLSGETLYGTTAIGGLWGDGMVFAIRTNGTGFTNLHSFISTIDGANPASALVLSGNTLYGTAGVGISGGGTVFAVNTNSLGFTNLYSFSAVGYDASNTATNSDGTNPNGLVSAGGRLYGTTGSGGTSGNGTVFSLSLGTISPPTLAISLLGTNLILTWPADAVGFTLHCATNLFHQLSGLPLLWNRS